MKDLKEKAGENKLGGRPPAKAFTKKEISLALDRVIKGQTKYLKIYR